MLLIIDVHIPAGKVEIILYILENMKTLKVSLLFVGLGLFFVAEISGQTTYTMPGLSRSGGVNNMNVTVPKYNPNSSRTGNKAIDDAINKERQREQKETNYYNSRITNRYTTRFIHTIKVDDRTTLYYSENEYAIWLKDCNDLKNIKTVTTQQYVNNPRYRDNNTTNQANNMSQMFDFENNDFELAVPESIFSSTNTTNSKDEKNMLESLLVSTNNQNEQKILEELLSVNNTNGLDRNTTVIIRDDYPVLPAFEMIPVPSSSTSREKEKQNYWQSKMLNINDIAKFADNTLAEQWNTIYSSIGNEQRFATIIGFMNEANGGKMPDLIDATGNQYWFKGKNEAVFIIAKDGSTISYTDLKGIGWGGGEKGALGDEVVSLDNNLKPSIKDNIIKPEQEIGKKNEIELSVSMEKHYNYIASNSKEFSINESGAITGWGISSEMGPSASAKAGVKTSSEVGANLGVSAGKAEGNILNTFVPMMTINRDGSVNFAQSGIELSVEGGAKVEIGVLNKKIKAGPVGIGFDIYNPDINNAIKQLPQETALKMISDFANNDNAVSTIKRSYTRNPNPPKHNYDTTIHVNDKATINQLLENISNITEK